MDTNRTLAGWSAALVVLLLFPLGTGAFSVPPNDGFVTDAKGILSEEQKLLLEQKLDAYRKSTSNEIAIVIVESLDGKAIEDAGLEIARKWGVGSTKDNGILLLVAYDERTVRFDVGYGLEGAVPDIVAKGIIDTDIVPHFRDGDYFGGIEAAVDSLQKHIGEEYTSDRYASSAGAEDNVAPFVFFVLFILFQWMLAILGRTKSWWLGGVFGGIGGVILAILFSWWLSIPVLVVAGLLLDFIVSKAFHRRGRTQWWAGGGWGPGGGFGGGSGGGFGGFGGGGFGGGGASGKW